MFTRMIHTTQLNKINILIKSRSWFWNIDTILQFRCDSSASCQLITSRYQVWHIKNVLKIKSQIQKKINKILDHKFNKINISKSYVSPIKVGYHLVGKAMNTFG